MQVASKASLLALCLAAVSACAGVKEGGQLDAARDSPPGTADGGGNAALGCSITKRVEIEPQPADVLLLLDRSGSMQMAFGSGTRYQAVASALAEVVSAHARFVRFGYQEFPSRQGCEGQALLACCASPPTVGVAADHAGSVLSAIASAGPMDGSTPTTAALRAAYQYYDQLYDGIDNRYVLLATDGAPDCTLAGALAAGSDACREATAEIVALASVGVRVIVLGVGADSGVDPTGDTACLDALARSGGAAASPGSPGYYTATNVDGLNVAIERIFGGIRRSSCSLRFPTDLEDTSTVALFLDGQQIPRTSFDGWRLELGQSPPVALVTGVYCEAIQTFQITTIDVRFGCPPGPLP